MCTVQSMTCLLFVLELVSMVPVSMLMLPGAYVVRVIVITHDSLSMIWCYVALASYCGSLPHCISMMWLNFGSRTGAW